MNKFTIEQYRSILNATGELSALLRDISGKTINVEGNKTG